MRVLDLASGLCSIQMAAGLACFPQVKFSSEAKKKSLFPCRSQMCLLSADPRAVSRQGFRSPSLESCTKAAQNWAPASSELGRRCRVPHLCLQQRRAEPS